MSFRAARSFGALAFAWVVASAFRAATGSIARWATRATGGMHLREGFGKLLQFFFTELAILVGIEFHGVFDHALGAGWRGRAIGTASALRTATLLSATGSAWLSLTLTTGTTTLRISGLRTAALSSTTGSASGTTATAGSTTLWSQFVFGQLAVFVFIERQQRSGCILQFVRRDHAVVIDIEGFDNGDHRWPTTSRPAGASPLSASLTSTSTRSTGRLSHRGRRTGNDQESERPHPAFHGTVSKGLKGSISWASCARTISRDRR